MNELDFNREKEILRHSPSERDREEVWIVKSCPGKHSDGLLGFTQGRTRGYGPGCCKTVIKFYWPRCSLSNIDNDLSFSQTKILNC